MLLYKTLEVSISENNATVWLNRPNAKNAIDLEMYIDLTNCFLLLDKMKNVKTIVLRGKGKIFCSGADILWMQQSGVENYSKNLKDSAIGAKCFQTIYNVSKPTICIAHGAAYGGAIGLLSACDIAISTTNTKFCFSEVRLGLAPSTIMPYVLTRINSHTAKLLTYTASPFSENDALRYNLVDMVCSNDEVEKRISDLLTDISKGTSEAVNECKSLINRLTTAIFSKENIKYTIESISKLKKTKKSQKRLKSFVEKTTIKTLTS